MKFSDYGFRIDVTYSRQAPFGRGKATFTDDSVIINETSYDFVCLVIKFNGTEFFTLKYTPGNMYRILGAHGLKPLTKIHGPKSHENFTPYILALTKTLLPATLGPEAVKQIRKIIAKHEAKTTLPVINFL